MNGERIPDLFRFEQVGYRYGDKRAALKNVTFGLAEQRKIAIVGENGAGKSTLVLHMNGLLLPSEGNVLFRGNPVTRQNRDAMIRHVGIVFQDPDDQIVSLTVREDVAFGLVQAGLDADEIRIRTERSLDELRISHLADRSPHELSFGQRKRVAVAGVLAMETDVVVFDEPMAFLDPRGRRHMRRVMEELAQRGKTVVVTTHDMQLAAEWADDVVVMKEGECLGTFPPKELFTRPSLLEKAGLELPPAAELIAEVWDGSPDEFPVTMAEAKSWLRRKWDSLHSFHRTDS